MPSMHMLQDFKNRLGEFARKIVLADDVDPDHGWRHCFKTVSREFRGFL
jgi:hypothetical protein